jgi:hypothetical protein
VLVRDQEQDLDVRLERVQHPTVGEAVDARQIPIDHDDVDFAVDHTLLERAAIAGFVDHGMAAVGEMVAEHLPEQHLLVS